FGYGEDCEEDQGKGHAGNCCDLLRQKINEAQRNERESDQTQTHRDFNLADFEIERHAKFSLAAMAVPQDEYGQSLRCEAPHHTEGVCFTENENVATAEQDRGNLQEDDQVENAMRRAELPMRMAKPLRENAVFRN